MREVKDGSAHLVFASPPFTNHRDGTTLNKSSYLEFLGRVLSEARRTLQPGGVLVVINTDLRDHARYNRGDTRFDGLVWQKHCDIRKAAEQIGFECVETKIWAKSLKRNMYRYSFSYIQFFRLARGKPRTAHKGRAHPEFAADIWLLQGGTQRLHPRRTIFRDAIHPEIVRRCLDQFSQPGDVVVCPFAGSGTVLAVSHMMGRRCIGYEINRTLQPLICRSIKSPESFPAYREVVGKAGRSVRH
jgi:DNA modification methylase